MSNTKVSQTKILVIVGPTASGKTELGIKLAKSMENGPPPGWRGAEIISADSRQVYRGLDIGTGKDKSFPQHLVDVAEIGEDYNVSHFVRDAKKIIRDIHARGKLPIIVGGTGFWIDALVYDIKLPDVKPDPKLRARLEKLSVEELFEKLKKLDPVRAEKIDRYNARRLVRALEVALSIPPRPPFTVKGGVGGYTVRWLGLNLPKEELYARIEKRLDDWFTRGLIEETKKLTYDQALHFGLAYAAVAKYLRGKIDEKTMCRQALNSIKQYAKRQLTWWRRNQEIKWVSISQA